MPGKMRAALTPFFTQRHEDENAKLQRKIWAVLEKNIDLLFLRFYIVGFSKAQCKSQISPMSSFSIQPFWDSQVSFCR